MKIYKTILQNQKLFFPEKSSKIFILFCPYYIFTVEIPLTLILIFIDRKVEQKNFIYNNNINNFELQFKENKKNNFEYTYIYILNY